MAQTVPAAFAVPMRQLANRPPSVAAGREAQDRLPAAGRRVVATQAK
jgi:hypothetical protein